MAKVTPSTIAGAYASTTELNANFALIAAEFENCVSLNGASPSALTADLDLNNQDLLNVGAAAVTSLTINGTAFTPATELLANTITGNLTVTGDITGSNVNADGATNAVVKAEGAAGSGTFEARSSTGISAYNKWFVGGVEASRISVSPSGQLTISTGGTTTALTLSAGQDATFEGEVIGTGFTGTLDGILGGGTPAAATVTDLTASGDFTYDSIVQPKIKIIEIVNWDMDFNTLKIVPHGLTWANIRNVDVMIRDDALTQSYKLAARNDDTTNVEAQIFIIDTQNIQLSRTAGGLFDSTNFDSTGGFVRGWITITYV